MMQTQLQLAPKKHNMQDLLLARMRKSRVNVTVFLMNGFQLRGQIGGYDAFVVIIYSDGKQQMVYKHAISTIVPEKPIDLDETGE